MRASLWGTEQCLVGAASPGLGSPLSLMKDSPDLRLASASPFGHSRTLCDFPQMHFLTSKREMEPIIRSGQIHAVNTGREYRKDWSAGLPPSPGGLEIFKEEHIEDQQLFWFFLAQLIQLATSLPRPACTQISGAVSAQRAGGEVKENGGFSPRRGRGVTDLRHQSSPWTEQSAPCLVTFPAPAPSPGTQKWV